MLAEGEFNRFYIRGVCLRAIEEVLLRSLCTVQKWRNMRVLSQSRRSGKELQRRLCFVIYVRTLA